MDLAEILIGSAAFLTAVGSILTVVVKKDNDSVKESISALTTSLEYSKKDNDELREKVQSLKERLGEE